MRDEKKLNQIQTWQRLALNYRSIQGLVNAIVMTRLSFSQFRKCAICYKMCLGVVLTEVGSTAVLCCAEVRTFWWEYRNSLFVSIGNTHPGELSFFTVFFSLNDSFPFEKFISCLFFCFFLQILPINFELLKKIVFFLRKICPFSKFTQTKTIERAYCVLVVL